METTKKSLVSLLKSNSSNIKEARAIQLSSSIHLKFKQELDRLHQKIKDIEIQMEEQLLNILPTDSQSLVFDKDTIDSFTQDRINNVILKEQYLVSYKALREEFQSLFGIEYKEPENLLK